MRDEEFRGRLATQGYDEVRTIEYDAHHRPDLHVHDFDALGMVTAGELTIVLDEGAETFRVGDVYDVPSGTRHAEHTGDAPTTALVGLRHLR